ncbi:MAG: aminopeptidase P family protein [Leptospiraceae bacterium]|nr:aminopeptidase P family protein [Leptospiraceae bacterium]MCP5501419.1 aminopeptidase P family protein [Leptospiraceae bacterium]
MEEEIYSKEELGEFKKVQQLAYRAVEAVRKELFVGISEKQAARMIDDYLLKEGISGFFHRGFAWFGDRSGFVGFNRPLHFAGMNLKLDQVLPPFFKSIPHLGLEFLPSDRKLEEGMAVILDVAPAVEGRAADIGYSFAFGSNPEVEKALLDLEVFRSLILEMVHKEKHLSEIYNRVSEVISELGYRNCHSLYPEGVLGHRIGKIPFDSIPSIDILGFPLQTYAYLAGQMASEFISGIGSENPNWNEKSNYRIGKGLWSVEPHIGKDTFGVKWEELLVVTDTEAYWLEEEPPHVKLWKEHKKEVIS